jgi:hypothetical protein
MYTTRLNIDYDIDAWETLEEPKDLTKAQYREYKKMYNDLEGPKRKYKNPKMIRKIIFKQKI